MKKIRYIILVFLAIAAVYSCKDGDTEFRKFLDGHELIYPGAVRDVKSTPGNLRAELKWKFSSDPSIAKYVIYWNNKQDSVVVNAAGYKPSDTVKVIVPNLNEYTYSFTIYAFDVKGSKSIPFEVNNVKIYGSLYQSRLLNRPYDAANPYSVNDNSGAVTLNFGTPDTINISTTIKYTNTSGAFEEKQLAPTDNSITLTNYKAGTEIQYKSSYIPAKGSLDTFFVANYDVFPKIFTYVELDRSLFREVQLPNDAYADFGTSLSKLWDGSVGPQGYPNIFHTNGNSLPVHFTFDLGKVYNNLGRMEETGRDCCHNPDNFEVWGIANITNAATTLPANNSGWTAESIAKGWTLLKEVVRTDDGKSKIRFDLMDNPPPVRYIRIRIKHNANGEGSYSNLSELTLWNKQ